MTYSIEFKPRAIRDLKGIDKTVARRVAEKIELLKEDLASARSCYRTASGSERDKESAVANVALDPAHYRSRFRIGLAITESYSKLKGRG
ncbi:MAG TPA: type II toxin-antitoxin system RelE/ParE family toxin [Pyrinomonadaceae bacterium]|nr:type II toxin-antitoxin system RelE/ParE family toxin [Pyrinomonadaceae bacterium]